MKRICQRFLSLFAACAMTLPLLTVPVPASAASDDTEPIIVVSLGDSYSSGEGIEPFYGQDKDWEDKITCEDWLAHRSELSWPGQIRIPGIDEPMSHFKADGENAVDSDVCKWYFCAVSGAETIHFKESQVKYTNKTVSVGVSPFWATATDHMSSYSLPPQLDVFDEIAAKGETVDYVTLSIGGNDLGFEDVVSACAIGATNNTFLVYRSLSTYGLPTDSQGALEELLDAVWNNWDSTYRPKFEQAYRDVRAAAGSQAYILVTGYPRLFDEKGEGAVISQYESEVVNQAVTGFNHHLQSLVESLNDDHFVFVEGIDEEFAGHGAYSGAYEEPLNPDGPWINKILLSKQDEDLEQGMYDFVSAYSVHPNIYGAQAYARRVNAKIAELEPRRRAERAAEKEKMKNIRWVVKPTIAVDDILVGDHYAYYDTSPEPLTSPYVYFMKDGKYGLIDYAGHIAAEAEYDSYNGESFFLDDHIAVFDSVSGNTVAAVPGSFGGEWTTEQQKGTFGASTFGSICTSYFYDPNDHKVYGHNSHEGVYAIEGSDAAYIVQEAEQMEKDGVTHVKVRSKKFFLCDTDGNELTKRYKYAYSNGSGYVGGDYPTCAFSDDGESWDMYTKDGTNICSQLAAFDCNKLVCVDWNPESFRTGADPAWVTGFFGRSVPFCASEGYIAAKDVYGECFYLDLEGNFAVDYDDMFEDIRPVHNGLAWVKYNGKWGVIALDSKDAT